MLKDKEKLEKAHDFTICAVVEGKFLV